MCFDRRIAFPHQGPDRGWSGIENIHLVLFYHFPEPAMVWIVRHTFKHHFGRAVDKRSVNNIAMACHPADIRRAPEYFARFVIENIVEGGSHPSAIAARG